MAGSDATTRGTAPDTAPWLDEILRNAGDISAATAAQIQRAAEAGYQLPSRGEAWAQWTARQYAKIELATIATENDPDVRAAFQADQQAREHADSLDAAWDRPDGEYEDDGTPEGLAYLQAKKSAEEAYVAYTRVHDAALVRHSVQVRRAFLDADSDFLESRRDELEAAQPGSFKDLLASARKNSASIAAADVLGYTGELLAGGEAGVRDAILGLNSALDLAHAAGISPDLARSLVTTNARLGEHGEFYLAEELLAWDTVYDRTWQPDSGPDEFRALHARQRPQDDASMKVAAEALTAAGVQLAQAEAAFERHHDRFEDAADFAAHAGVPADEVHALVCARAQPGPVAGAYVALTVESWDIYTSDADARRADSQVPEAFWDLDLRARAAKGTGGYDAAAAIWTIARSQLPEGHALHSELDELVTSLRIAAQTGQYVSPDGHLIPLPKAAVIGGTADTAQPPASRGAQVLADEVWAYVADRCEEPGWRVIHECWDLADVTAAIGGAATLEEAVAALTPVAEAGAGRDLAALAFPAHRAPLTTAPAPGNGPAAGAARRTAKASTAQTRRTP